MKSQASLAQFCIPCFGDQTTHLMGHTMDVKFLKIVWIGNPNPYLYCLADRWLRGSKRNLHQESISFIGENVNDKRLGTYELGYFFYC